MEEKTPRIRPKASPAKSSTYRRLALPTILTIAIGSLSTMGARPNLLLGSDWKLIGSEEVQLDPQTYQPYDNHDGSVAKLGVSPCYFVAYNSPNGKENWVALANKKGGELADPNLPTVDPANHSVRFLVILKNHKHVSFDETKSRVVEGNGLKLGNVHGKFRAISVPREGILPDFHPADIARVELQVRSK